MAESYLCEFCHNYNWCNCSGCSVVHRSTSDSPVRIAGKCTHHFSFSVLQFHRITVFRPAVEKG